MLFRYFTRSENTDIVLVVLFVNVYSLSFQSKLGGLFSRLPFLQQW
jgi:hypothetical protein